MLEAVHKRGGQEREEKVINTTERIKQANVRVVNRTPWVEA